MLTNNVLTNRIFIYYLTISLQNYFVKLVFIDIYRANIE